jgi:type III secretion protein J
MSPARPVHRTLVLMLALALATLLGACKQDLYTKMSEREVNEMLAVLLRGGIDAERVQAKDGSNSIRVETSQRMEAIELLRMNGYPKPSFAAVGDVFKGNGLVASPTEERAKLGYAVSEALSQTISSIDGVLSARVHVALGRSDAFRLDRTPPSASVLIRHDASVDMGPLVRQIRTLVANSVEGISYDQVSIVMLPIAQQTLATMARPPEPALLDKVLAMAPWLLLPLLLLGGALAWLRRRGAPPLAGLLGKVGRAPRDPAGVADAKAMAAKKFGTPT